MSTPGHREFSNRFTKSGHAQHPVIVYHKKPRSQSLTPERDELPGASANEITATTTTTITTTTTESTCEKPKVSEIRKKFEPSKPQEPPKPNGYKKRTSIPVSTNIQTNTSHLSVPVSSTAVKVLTTHFNQTVDVNPTETTIIRPSMFLKSKSPSPSSPLSDGTNGSSKTNMIRASLSKMIYNLGNMHVEEDENPPSTVSNSNNSLLTSENNASEPVKTVRKIREIFDATLHHHYYQAGAPTNNNNNNDNSPAINKLVSLNMVSNIPEPPLRRPPRPENYIKSQLSNCHSLPSLDTADSITCDSSYSSNPTISKSDLSDASFSDEEQEYEAERQKKLRRCLEEVNTTEKTYVGILYVLAVKVSAEVKNTCDADDNAILTFNNTYKTLLGTIQQIYNLHHDMIAPFMENYITGNTTDNMWSILEKYFKVIEVLYKNYYVTYSETQGKLDDLCKTNPLINEAMLKCQCLLGNLYPITQLNCPNQRLLRYILCMKTYMKYLDQNSIEYKYVRSIHDELDRIAGRCEEELLVSATQLNELKERLDNKFECIKEHRQLVWHGPIKKISPRRYNDIAQRYMILFSDCILVCSEESGRKLEIKRELSMRGITIDVAQISRPLLVTNNDSQNNPMSYYPFRVNAVEKSYEFLVDKEVDRELWVKKIRQASNAFNKRSSTIDMRQSIVRADEQQYGTRAPIWVNDLDVSRCQNCNNRFRTTIILSRRHHCRCCGRCVCGSCSTKKLVLDYCKSEGEVRVCDTCYTDFTGQTISKNSSIWPKTIRDMDRTLLYGDFRSNTSGTNIWIALQDDFQLHVFGARLDQAEDYSIILTDLIDLQFELDKRKFELKEPTKNHSFSIESNHQLIYPKNDLVDDELKTADNKLNYYAQLWYNTMQLARSTTLPDWYIRKRDSTDSGVSNDG